MRIVVGTLHTCENEFDQCMAAVARQTLPAVSHFVIDGLPNVAAHHALYRRFMDSGDACDLFIKVDADMVVENPNLFESIADRFRARPDIDAMLIAVHDFYTDRLIDAMHIYRSNVTWSLDDEQVFVDPCPVPRSRIIHDTTDLAPAASHCKNPSPFQAFHFGIHKGVKVRAALAQNRRAAGLEHCNNLEHTWRHFLRSGDVRLGLASLGGELALRDRFAPQHVDYDHPEPRRTFERYASATPSQLRRLVRQLRRTNWGVGSAKMRWDVLREGPLRYGTRRIIPQPLHPLVSKSLRAVGVRATPHVGMVHVETPKEAA